MPSLAVNEDKKEKKKKATKIDSNVETEGFDSVSDKKSKEGEEIEESEGLGT